MAKGKNVKAPKPQGTAEQRRQEEKWRREGALDGPDVNALRRASRRGKKTKK